MQYDSVIFINGREIAVDKAAYFIADIASNHDGNLDRAKNLIRLAKDAGADAVKFQHFKANKIVSDYGFKNLGGQISHQSSWKKSVFEVYKQYECNREWSEELANAAKEVGIDFMTTPYDEKAIALLDHYIPAYKIGSGDITWTVFIEMVARKGKPVILATGASSMADVVRAVNAVIKYNRQIVLLQCNTNYTGSIENFRHINLKVLQTYAITFPNMLLGLSDHTPGHSSVLGAISLGARVIEKHFTDDNTREGPDHAFSMNPKTWHEMIERSRDLELSLGDGIKIVEENETDTIVVQRRCLRFVRDMKAGEKINLEDLEALRPAPINSVPPFKLNDMVGKLLSVSKVAGDALYYSDIKEPLC
ncbi:MAG: N-acetylneuraminate synthase family protein [Thermodesulfovibrionales bacterium]